MNTFCRFVANVTICLWTAPVPWGMLLLSPCLCAHDGCCAANASTVEGLSGDGIHPIGTDGSANTAGVRGADPLRPHRCAGHGTLPSNSNGRETVPLSHSAAVSECECRYCEATPLRQNSLVVTDLCRFWVRSSVQFSGAAPTAYRLAGHHIVWDYFSANHWVTSALARCAVLCRLRC
jgi:hypothetical protein